MSQYPPLPIVDRNDRVIGEATLEDIYKNAYIHRVVFVVINEESGRLLMQRRSAKVSTNANRWDVSAAGHVDSGEDYSEAVKRELQEELGIKGVELKESAYYFSDVILDGKKLKRFVKIYTATLPIDTKFSIDTNEVSEVSWFTVDELKEGIKQQPQEYNSDLNQSLKKIDVKIT